MKTVLQRVCGAQVRVDGETIAAIDRGVLALVGVERGDTEADAVATARKVASLRMFPGKTPMDRTLTDAQGTALVISQFTLAATVRKGRRPSFDPAETPERASELYELVCSELEREGIGVQRGRFGAHMEVSLVGDGPVTLLIFARDGAVQ